MKPSIKSKTFEKRVGELATLLVKKMLMESKVMGNSRTTFRKKNCNGVTVQIAIQFLEPNERVD